MQQKIVNFCLNISNRTMYKIIALFSIFYLTSCNSQTSNSSAQNIKEQNTGSEYKWPQLTDSAAFPKSYNFQIFSVRDTLWVLHHEITWFSTDGKNWNKSPLINIIKNNGFLDYVWFKNALYGLGTFDGNIEHYKLTTQIAKTTDLKNWQIISENSNLPKRFFYHPFVFNNKIWIVGGEDKNTKYSDIWNSTDGIDWIKQKDNLPFGKVSRGQIIFLNGKLFLLDNDVWSSADGLNWQIETNEILKGENIFGYAAVVFDNKIWLLGCNRNGKFSSQVLVSSDGKTWHSEDAPWTPRGGIAATVHKGKIYMTGGKYGGTPDRTEFVYSNDVWALEKKK